MKRIFLSLLFYLGVFNSYSQNVVDLLLMLSKSYSIPRNVNVVKSALSDYESQSYPPGPFELRFDKIDLKAGYIQGRFISGESFEFSLCYWNLSNGEKLLGYEIYQCATVCYSELNFYTYSSSKRIQKCDKALLPSPIISEDEFFDYAQMEAEFPKDIDRLKREVGFESRIYLPQNGKNIKIYFEPYLDGVSDETANMIRYKERRKGIILEWKDGHFERGDWIMKE
ncbi:MAG: hypothetical protein NVV82_14485 [Sporocytophaga sp.]|nr:hypothetical protein [Sporocytophaga sp.]